MSLKSRLALARLALHIRAEQASVDQLAPVLAAGVDLLVLGSCGDDQRDAEVLRDFREVYARLPLLLAIDNPAAAQQASADVVHVERPGWKLLGGGQPRGHEWTLLGRNARDARTIRKPGNEWDYLFVGPLGTGHADTSAVRAAVEAQPPLTADALPWFAYGDFSLTDVEAALAVGARRIALGGDVLDADGDVAALVAGIAGPIDAAWAADPKASSYRSRALAF